MGILWSVPPFHASLATQISITLQYSVYSVFSFKFMHKSGLVDIFCYPTKPVWKQFFILALQVPVSSIYLGETCKATMWVCHWPVWTLGSPEVSRKQVASFLLLSRPREQRSDHFSLGDSGWVRLQPSSSDRATLASPFCLESDSKTETHGDVNAKAFTEAAPGAQTKADVYCIKSVFFCDEIQFDWDVIRRNLIPVCYCLYARARLICQTHSEEPQEEDGNTLAPPVTFRLQYLWLIKQTGSTKSDFKIKNIYKSSSREDT